MAWVMYKIMKKKTHNIQQPNSTTELNVQAPTDFGETDTECSKTKLVWSRDTNEATIQPKKVI